MEVGVVSEKVEVQANAAVLQDARCQRGGNRHRYRSLAASVNGRNYTRLILLMPGTSDQGGSQSNGTFSGTQVSLHIGERPAPAG